MLHRTADPGHAQPAAPSGAVSRPSSRSSRQSSGSPTIGKCARLGGPGPSEPREHGPQGNMGELTSSWLHPLKNRSLRKTRYGSPVLPEQFSRVGLSRLSPVPRILGEFKLVKLRFELLRRARVNLSPFQLPLVPCPRQPNDLLMTERHWPLLGRGELGLYGHRL